MTLWCDLGVSLGAWMIHVVLIATGKFTIDAIPGVTPNISWTAVNLSYLAVRPCPHYRNCSIPSLLLT